MDEFQLIKEPEKLDMVRWNKIIEKEINNQSDRAIAILCISILDIQLEKLLKEFLIDDDKIENILFGSQMPLSTFSSKINMCYYLGIISEHEFKTLNTMRKIRNKFAHEIEIDKFEDNQSIIDLCQNLSIPDKMYAPHYILFCKDEAKIFDTNPFRDSSAKNRFIQTFYYLTMYFEFRYIEIFPEKRKTYIAKTFVENLQNNMEVLQKLKDTYIISLNKNKSLLLKLKELLEKKIKCDDNSKNIKELKEVIEELAKIEKKANHIQNSGLFGVFEDELTVSPDDYLRYYHGIIEAINKSYGTRE